MTDNKARVLILRTAGTNCDEETGHAFRLAGAEVEAIHINRILSTERSLDEFDILGLSGGFSYGDNLGAGTVLAGQLRTRLKSDLEEFIAAGKLVIGICNGFQVLVRLGILPGWGGEKAASLIENPSGKFEDRWVHLRVESDTSPFLSFARVGGASRVVRYPVAHKEGRFVVRDPEMIERLREAGQIAFSYCDAAGAAVGGAYPACPNGSHADIAGITNPEGNVLGLMPHPERFLSRLQDPVWTRRPVDLAAEDTESVLRGGEGFSLFQSAVSHVTAQKSVESPIKNG